MRNYIKAPYLKIRENFFFFDDSSEKSFAEAYEKAEQAIGQLARAKYRPPFAVWRKFPGCPKDVLEVGKPWHGGIGAA